MLETLGGSIDQIPKLYAYFEEEGEYYLAQELIEGQTLGEKISKEGPMSEAACREFLTSFLSLLNEVHSQGIIHRDIKPSNIIMRARDGRPALIDFGIVKEAVSLSIDKAGNTRTVNFGTPGYTPYEQARGTPVFASDLYSLGVTAIYALTGKHLNELIDPTSGDIHWRGHVSNVSAELAATLDKAIEPNYRDRYRTARGMLDAINSLAPVELAGQMARRNQAAVKTAEVIDDPSTVLIAGAAQEETTRQIKAQQLIIEGGEAYKPGEARPPDPPTIPCAPRPQGQQEWAVPQEPPAIISTPDKPYKRRVSRLLILVGICVIGIGVLLIVFVFNPTSGSMPDNNRPPEPAGAIGADSATVEDVSYYLEMKEGNKRATGFEPLDFSKSFRFHFTTRGAGYLYIIGPGANDAPTVFLTSKPIPATGMTTNKVEAGANFQFPKTWIRLETRASLATYTVIFSRAPLQSPAFLASSSMQEVTAADLRQVEAMSTRIEAGPVGDGAAVRHFAPTGNDESKPLIFDIRLSRK